MRRLFFAAALAVAGCLSPEAGAEPLFDFETDAQVRSFSFHDGAEFPGSSGGFERGAGETGAGGALRFRFECRDGKCGQYVQTAFRPPQPLSATATTYLSFAYKPSPGASLVLRLTDESGQTFQVFPRGRTIEQIGDAGWRRIVQPLAVEGGEHWGGAGDGRVRGGIVEVAFVARATRGDVEGVIGLDTIEHVDVAKTARFNLTARASVDLSARFEPPELGLAAHRLDDEAALGATRAAGVRMIRVDHTMGVVERGGHAFTDSLVQRFGAAGQSVVIILDRGHHYPQGPAIGTPAHRALYLRYVTETAARYRGKNVVLEIFNEPDVSPHVSGDRFVPPEELGKQTLATIEAARRGDPNARLITAGLSWANPSYVQAFLGEMAKAPALVSHLEGFAVHLYRGGPPESAVDDLQLLRAIMRDTIGKELPIWVTEWGVTSALTAPDGDGKSARAHALQAALLPRLFLTLWAGGARTAFWYDLHDDGADPRNNEHNFGLFRENGAPKPAMAALRTYNGIAKGRRYVGAIAGTPPLVHALRLEGGDGDVVAVWSEAGGSVTEIAVDGAAFSAYRTALGEDRALRPGVNIVPLREAQGPLYFIAR